MAVVAAERRDAAVVATIQNFGPDPLQVPITLLANDTVVAAITVDLRPFAATDAQLEGALPATGPARVVVEDLVGYQVDNVRHLVLDPAPAASIAIVVADPTGATGGLYVERALAVAGRGREFRVDAMDGREFSTWTDDAVARYSALVVLGTRTLDRSGRERVNTYVHAGGQVLLALGPDIDPATLLDVAGTELGVTSAMVTPDGGATLVASDGRHPIFRPFLNPASALGDIRVEQHRRLTDQAGRTVLARFSGGDSALTEQQVGEGRLLIFTSDMDNRWSRFPLSPAFVPFTVETARYLTAGTRQPQSWVLPELPPGAPPSTGVVAVTGIGGETYLAAVNIDSRESSPLAMSAEEFATGIGRTTRGPAPAPDAEARDVESQQRWWQIGLLVMLVALAGEGLVGRRAT